MDQQSESTRDCRLVNRNKYEDDRQLPTVSTAALIIACFAGILGCGFLCAGILMLGDFSRRETHHPGQGGRHLGEILDMLFLFGAISTARDGAKNWSSRRDARRFVYAGIVGLALMTAALCLR